MSKAVEARIERVSVNGKSIVHGVDFKLEEGEIALLAGPSGCGKSTILKIIAGLIPGVYSKYEVKGSVRVFGEPPQEAVAKGLISYIPQDPTSFFTGITVGEELSLIKNYKWLVKDLEGKERSSILELSDGQLYRLLIASALEAGSRVLLLDEPTSHLDYKCLSNLVRVISEASERGVSTLIVDHRIELIGRYCDRIILLKEYEKPRCRGRARTKRSLGSQAVRANNVYYSYDDGFSIKNLNITVHESESAGIIGFNGTGKSTILKILAGILKPSKGEVFVREPVFLIPQNPIYVFSSQTVEEELKVHSKLAGSSLEEHEDLIELLGLKGKLQSNPYTLSVGEARRLLIAISVIHDPKVLLMDEPTIGVDPYYKEVIIDIIQDYNAGGGALVVATHDFGFASSLDRVYTLKRGGVLE